MREKLMKIHVWNPSRSLLPRKLIQCNNLRQESMMVAEYKRVHAIADEDIQEN